jgi:hypothetical protein
VQWGLRAVLQLKPELAAEWQVVARLVDAVVLQPESALRAAPEPKMSGERTFVEQSNEEQVFRRVLVVQQQDPWQPGLPQAQPA